MMQADIVPIDFGDGNVRFRINDWQVYSSFLAGDFERFALSSIESFLRSREGNETMNFTAWRLLESYYSAFFAAHALMRSLGGGLTYVGSVEASRFEDLCSLHGIGSYSVASGQVLFRTLELGSDTLLQVRAAAPGKGVHDSFWREFCRFMHEKAEEAIRDDLPDSTEFLESVLTLSGSILEGGIGSSSWLAETRNAVNYRHEYDTWFPYKRGQKISFPNRRLSENAEHTFRSDFSRKKQAIQQFESVNAIIVHILWNVIDLFVSISSASGHFGGRYRRMMATYTER